MIYLPGYFLVNITRLNPNRRVKFQSTNPQNGHKRFRENGPLHCINYPYCSSLLLVPLDLTMDDVNKYMC